MKLLFVTPYLPLATKPRPFHFIEHLARAHEVHLVAFDPADGQLSPAREDYRALREWCASITCWPLPRLRRYRQVLASVPARTPARVAYYGLERYQPAIAALARRLDVAAIHVDRLRLAPLCVSLPQPKLVDATDCISEYLRQCVPVVPPLHRPAYALERWKTARYEQLAAREYDLCLVTTPREHALLGETTYSERVRVVPNLLDDALFDGEPAASHVPDGPPMVLFAGNLSYLPNTDAACWLLETLWPRVRARLSGARLVLAGNEPHPRLRRLAHGQADVEITGYVPDMPALMREAMVVVAPMQIAVGFPNKIAEALALGQAVVASPRAAACLEGCAAALSVASEAEAFAEAVVRLASQPQERARLGAAGREYARALLRPARVAAGLDGVYDELMDVARGSAMRDRSQAAMAAPMAAPRTHELVGEA